MEKGDDQSQLLIQQDNKDLDQQFYGDQKGDHDKKIADLKLNHDRMGSVASNDSIKTDNSLQESGSWLKPNYFDSGINPNYKEVEQEAMEMLDQHTQSKEVKRVLPIAIDAIIFGIEIGIIGGYFYMAFLYGDLD